MMTSEEFVNRIKVAVLDATIKGAVSLLEKPPGRRPSPALLELSQWFNQLSVEDKEHVVAIVRLVTGSAVFGFLAVLDGERAIRTTEEKFGVLELRYNTGGQSVVLNDPEDEPLHDVFNAMFPQQ